MLMNSIRREWREDKVRPIPGNSPHDRPVSRGDSFAKESLRRSLLRHYTSAAGYTSAALLRFPGMEESIGPMEFKTKKQNQNISNPSGGAASRWSAPDAR